MSCLFISSHHYFPVSREDLAFVESELRKMEDDNFLFCRLFRVSFSLSIYLKIPVFGEGHRKSQHPSGPIFYADDTADVVTAAVVTDVLQSMRNINLYYLNGLQKFPSPARPHIQF